MKRRKTVWLVAALLALPARAQDETPGWQEELLYNPAERTRQGAAALGAGAPLAASEALDVAMRLEPANEAARYNAGTAHLLATSEKAAPLLESAARSQDRALAARAFYNLGNARMAAQDLPGAIEAYKDSLRRDSKNADAKFNLELALRRLQEQQKDQQKQQDQKQDQQDQQDQQKQDQNQQQQDQQDQQQKDQQQDQQQKDQQKNGEQQQDKEQQGQQGKEDQDQQKEQQQNPPKPGKQDPSNPLPQFKDLPDMDAQQAAAILEAIENLERAQRRTDAKKALKANARGKKDW